MSEKDDKKKLKTEEYFVLYMDMLGSEKRIDEDDDDTWLNAINNLYLKAIDYTMFLDEKVYRIKPQVKIFSDNIVVAVKFPKKISDHDNCLYFMMYVASYIQTHALIDYKWLIRGCLTAGAFYINKNFVWGKALTKAIRIESSIAVYPRIIIDEELVANRRRLTDQGYDNGPVREGDFLLPVMDDKDGLFSLDYFGILVNKKPDVKLRDIVDKSNKVISELEREAVGDMKILQKIEWVKSYVTLAERSELMDLEIKNEKTVLYP